MATREWIREDVGLLEDERYYAMTDTLIAAWEILMKATARQPGERYKDRDVMAFQLKRYGRPKAAQSVAALDTLGWIVEIEGGGLRIRGWDKYQHVYRGPSDDPVVKSERNSRRPTTDSDRAAIAAQRRADLEANASKTPFREAMAAAGFDPKRINGHPAPTALDEPGAVTVSSETDRAG